MRRKDHLRIADSVMEYYTTNVGHVHDSAINQIKRGSVSPDSAGWSKAHHTGREGHVESLIISARRTFNKGDLTSSAYLLGIIFHFIADGNCPGASLRRGDDLSKHSRWEQEISKLPLPQPRLYPMSCATDILGMEVTRRRLSPHSSLRESVELCLSIIELVWRPIDSKTPKEKALIEKAITELPRVPLIIAAHLPVIVGWILPVALGYLISWWFLCAYPVTLGASYWCDVRYCEPIRAKWRWCRFALDWYR